MYCHDGPGLAGDPHPEGVTRGPVGLLGAAPSRG